VSDDLATNRNRTEGWNDHAAPAYDVGAMAVRHKRPDHDAAFTRGFSWMSSDYSALWPDDAFLPLWMPQPKAPPCP
jgi:hypothetical protein